MASFFLAGEDCRCQISAGNTEVPNFSTYYSIKKFGVKYVRPRLEVPNSEGRTGASGRTSEAPGFGTAVRGLRTIELTIEEATLDLTSGQNVFTAPYSFQQNDYIWVKIYPYRDDLAQFHLVHILVDEVMHEGEVGQLQPMSFKGTSDGNYQLLNVTPA